MLAVLVAAACGSSGGTRADDSPAGQVRSLLRARATLLADGDVAGYLEAVGPEAEAHERMLAEGAAAVPLTYANVTFDPRGGGRTTETSFEDATVELVYRYEGLPKENVFRFALEYDLEKHGDRWVVTTSEVAESDARAPIWATGPVEHTRSEHFLALYRPGLPGAAEALEMAEQARRDLAERLSFFESDPVHLVVLAASEEEYAEIKGQPTDEGELAAAGFLFNSISRPEQRQMLVKAARLVRDDAVVAEDGERVPGGVVFRHELAHLALTRYDGPYTPAWVNEGAAMYLAGERRLPTWRAGLEAGLFDGMSVGAMDRESGLADGVAYAYANAAVLVLVEEFGVERFLEYYVGFLPLAPTPEFDADPTGVTLAERYDMSVSELDRRTREYMAGAAAAG